MDGVSWMHASQRMAIHRSWELPAVLQLGKTKARDPAQEWKRVHLRGSEDAHRSIGSNKEQLGKLRQLLACDCYNVCNMTDAEVLDRAVVMLVRGEWILLKRLDIETSKQSLGSGAVARSPTTAPIGRATVPISGAVPLQRSSGRLQAMAPTVKEPDETFDQDALAVTLRLAAAKGTPFCETCERGKRSRTTKMLSGAAS